MEIVNELCHKVSTVGSYVVYTVGQYVSYYTEATNIERHKNYYIVSYKYGDQIYKIKCKQGVKSAHIIKITGFTLKPTDENTIVDKNPLDPQSADDVIETDITDELLEYMGPHMDFHNIPVCPKDFNYTKLTFTFIHGDEKTFSENEVINFK